MLATSTHAPQAGAGELALNLRDWREWALVHISLISVQLPEYGQSCVSSNPGYPRPTLHRTASRGNPASYGEMGGSAEDVNRSSVFCPVSQDT